jgi:hypothetical protein
VESYFIKCKAWFGNNWLLLVFSFFISPVLVFAHEAVHFISFHAIGLEPYFSSLSMTKISGYEYTQAGFSQILAETTISKEQMAWAILLAPIFSILISLIGYYLSKKTKRTEFYIMSIIPLVIRVVYLLTITLKIDNRSLMVDEVVAARLLGIPALVVVLISFIFGLLVVSISIVKTKITDKVLNTLIFSVFGLAGYVAIDTIVNIIWGFRI